jgi:hypothetical protein
MKQNGNFAPLFDVAATDLSHEQFEADDLDGSIHSLGEYDPRRSQLIYSVLVSDKQTPGLAPTVETDRLEIETTAFRVTVLSTRLSMRSQNIGRMSIAEGASQPEIAAMRASKFSANSQV